MERSVLSLKSGEQGVLDHCPLSSFASTKLLEMGCFPGVKVCLIRRSLFGGMLCLRINHTCYMIDKEEAASLKLI
jgi:Fe2+ transport system protein FeoA